MVYTCTISDTKVTTSIMVAVSSSIRNPIDTFSGPLRSQVYRSVFKTYSPPAALPASSSEYT